MTPNNFLLLCVGFSYFCALLRQLFDAQFYPKNFYIFIMRVIISGTCGIVVSLLLSNIITHELTILGISGLGGMTGLSGITAIMKFRLSKKIKIEVTFEDEDDDNAIEIGDIKLKRK